MVVAATSFPAFGQAIDPNLQVRIESALPPPEIKPRLSETETVPFRRTETVTTIETVTLTPEERKRRLEMVLTQKNIKVPMGFLAEELDKNFRTFGIPATEKRKVKKTRVVMT